MSSTGDICFTVTEKDDPLGQILIPISSLRATKGQTIRAALQPHKKCLKPKGYLLYQCYVSCYKSSNDDATPIINNVTQDNQPHTIGSFAKLKRNLKRSPILTRAGPRKEGKHPSSLANFRGKLSRSFHDLFNLNYMTANIDIDEDIPKSRSTYNLDETGNLPDVISIAPNQSSISGGTKVTIEGKFLGFSKADILSLEICGCDCTDYVQYECSEIIHFTTREWHAGIGDLLFETASGGQRLFPGTFTYVDKISSLPRDLGKVEINPDDTEDQPIWMNSANASSLAIPDTSCNAVEPEKKVITCRNSFLFFCSWPDCGIILKHSICRVGFCLSLIPAKILEQSPSNFQGRWECENFQIDYLLGLIRQWSMSITIRGIVISHNSHLYVEEM